jgi:hypothetical protein
MKRCPQCNRLETDETLKFCRVDGATLVNDSSAIGEAGTAQFGSTQDASEVHTSLLPQHTDANINRATSPTTVLPAQSIPGTTLELNKSKRRVAIAAIGALIVIAIVTAAYFYVTRRSSAVINSVAVMPFVNESGNADIEVTYEAIRGFRN